MGELFRNSDYELRGVEHFYTLTLFLSPQGKTSRNRGSANSRDCRVVPHPFKEDNETGLLAMRGWVCNRRISDSSEFFEFYLVYLSTRGFDYCE